MSSEPNTPSPYEGPILAEALALLASHFDRHIHAEDIVVGLPVSVQSLSTDNIPLAMERLGLQASLQSLRNIQQAPLPAGVLMEDGSIRILIELQDGQVVLNHPTLPQGVEKMALEAFEAASTTNVICVAENMSSLQQKYIAPEPTGHWFWSKMLAQKKLLRDVIAGTLFANLIAVGVSLFALQVYDRVIPNQSITSLWVLTVGVAIAIAIEATLKIVRSGLVDISGRFVEIEVSAILFRKMLGMKMSSRPMTSSSMIYAMREFGCVREFFTTTSINSAADIPFTLIFFVLIYFIAGPISLVILVAMILIVLPNLFARKKMVQLSEETLGGNSAANQVLTEAAYGQETIKTMRAENFYQKKWEDLNALNSEKTAAQRILSAKLTFSAQAVQQWAYVSAIVAGVYLVFAGEITVGSIIAISILTTRCLSPITNLANTLVRWQQVKASLGALNQIIESDQEKSVEQHFVQAPSLAGDFVFDHLVFTYDEELAPVINIPALGFKAGKTTAILGSNGAGKSTLLMLLSGLYHQTSGTITLDGLALNQIRPDDLRRHIGYLSQSEVLFTGTIRENLDPSGRSYSDEALFAALEFSGLKKFIKTHPHGLDMKVLDGGKGVSTGQKLSIGLARLYLQNPSIVLLDEPTASFDQMLELHVVQNLKAWLAGKTCILTTHRNAALELADDILVLQQGNVALFGSADDVMKKLSAGAQPNTQPTPKVDSHVEPETEHVGR